MAVTSFTTTPAEDARLQAWATASNPTNPPTVKQLIIRIVQANLQAFEQSQNSGTAFAPPAYTPINPT